MCYLNGMVSPMPSPAKVVRNSAMSRPAVRGFGALKGKLAIDPAVDLTKPILQQVADRGPEPKPNA